MKYTSYLPEMRGVYLLLYNEKQSAIIKTQPAKPKTRLDVIVEDPAWSRVNIEALRKENRELKAKLRLAELRDVDTCNGSDVVLHDEASIDRVSSVILAADDKAQEALVAATAQISLPRFDVPLVMATASSSLVSNYKWNRYAKSSRRRCPRHSVICSATRLTG